MKFAAINYFYLAFTALAVGCSNQQATSHPTEASLGSFLNGSLSNIYFNEADKDALSIAAQTRDGHKVGNFEYSSAFAPLDFKGMNTKNDGHGYPKWAKTPADWPAVLSLSSTVLTAENSKIFPGKIRLNARASFAFDFDPNLLPSGPTSELMARLAFTCHDEGPWDGISMSVDVRKPIISAVVHEESTVSLVSDEFDPKTCHGDIGLEFTADGFTAITFDHFELQVLIDPAERVNKI